LITSSSTEQVIYTTRLPEIAGADTEAAAPGIYQTEIAKQRDLRVTIVGERVFAVAIDSQSRSETATDWRRGSVPDLAHELIELPADIQALCVRLVQLDLRFGAIDLVLDAEGRHWFLECNPNGQWAWIENRTGAPISSAIVDETERIGRK
jgi:glutathione synthase/RimK-type ligase-like ATP-grasp enzyme